ncbi:MAG TPA: cytochrome c biogenesis protein ResB [Parvularculaceae bacterium]|nr:cytochrome c biogenesis protein ResB [Parvularculaceae bacterium]
MRKPHLLRALARIEITIALALGAGALALAGERFGWRVGPLMAIPAFALLINLLAALTTNRTLSAQPALFAFHVGLAALALALGVDAMSSFTGNVEIVNGGAFDAAAVKGESRPWHRSSLDKISFRQKSFEIAYAPGMKRRATKSVVEIYDKGAWREAVIGDDKPLVIPPYRFYTTFNKGYAPLVTFTDAAGVAHSGAVHLPSYPLNEDRQANSFAPPGARGDITLWLDLKTPAYDVDNSWRFSIPADAKLTVIEGDKRRELSVGETIAIAGGALRYDGLAAWMGYSISANPYAAYAVAAALASLIALIWHIAQKIFAPFPGLRAERERCDAPASGILRGSAHG